MKALSTTSRIGALYASHCRPVDIFERLKVATIMEKQSVAGPYGFELQSDDIFSWRRMDGKASSVHDEKLSPVISLQMSLRGTPPFRVNCTI